MKEIELAFLCKVFNEAFEEMPSEVAEWYQKEVSENESDWVSFVDTCRELGKAR